VVLFDAPPSIGGNLRRAVDEIAAANGVRNRVTHREAWQSWKPRSSQTTAPGRSAPGQAWAVSLSRPGR
jgi:hypothetical protein